MLKSTHPFTQTGFIQQTVLRYLNNDVSLKKFYQYPFSIDSFLNIISDKEKQIVNRKLLVERIEPQYKGLAVSNEVSKNILSLKEEKTFTVTTAHQPNLLSGPLFVIYKIASTIKLSMMLNEKYPQQHFVPVYWMGSEDHDVEELAHFNLFGKKIEWKTDNTGAFGRKSTSTLTLIKTQLGDLLKNDSHGEEVKQLLEKYYFNQPTIATATRSLFNYLFGEYGLVIIDGDDAALKKEFSAVIKDELLNQTANKIVSDSIAELKSVNVESQAIPREINLFYLTETYRARIIKDGNSYKVNHQSVSFTESEILNELENHPERFSPNVILRPVFQESILPNLAFVGGGAEISYWLQMKNLFNHYNINYPMLVLRDTATLIDENIKTKIEKLGFTFPDVFKKTDELVNNFIQKNSSIELNFNLQRETIKNAFNQIQSQLIKSDASLKASAESELIKTFKSIDLLEDKLKKSEKKKLDTSIQQITKIKEKLFPNNSLQERHDNFLEHYLKSPQTFIDSLIKNFNAFEPGIKVLHNTPNS